MTDDVEDHDRPVAPRTGENDSTVPDGSEWTLAVQVPFDESGSHDLTSAIVAAVAEAEGVRPTEVKEPPLYEVLDVAALEASFFGSPTIGRESDAHRAVEFLYRGHRVVVRSDAWVQIYDVTDS